MAKVSLRAYNREIEAMIDRSHLDEAIAHCQHILKTFPKHLETYRLLGKSYLEAKRHEEAVDIFSRVLVAEPSDFVAQVGMSIIRDEQDKLDDAIWHMERAFETQPSNAAIQGELQRLYGRRDGAQPPRIRMTRGALAHMYMQGELYPQAISESKNVLEEDQGRSDMQALLAKAYYKSGQKNDAADAASGVLKRYPYCLDANRVLTDILVSDRPESAKVYSRRVVELDPYAAQVDGSIFLSTEVSDAAVMIEHLDWNGQQSGMPSDWRSARAISLESGSSDSEAQTDWRTDEFADSLATSPSVPEFDSEQDASSLSPTKPPIKPAEEDIPDFLREAGWGESTGTFDEIKSSTMFDDEPASAVQPLEQGDMPEWIKEMAPKETSIQPDEQDEEMPDWIKKIGTGELPVPSADSASDDQPDWLDQLGSETESAEERTAMPDETGNLGMGEQEQDDSFAWLENLAAKQGASEGLLTKPEDRLEEEPDWIKQAKGLAQESLSKSSAQDLQEESQTPDSQPSANTEELGKSDEERDDSFAWLENLAAKQGATEGLLTKPDERLEDEPEWVKQAKQSGETPVVASSTTAEEPESAGDETVEPVADVSAWLEGLDKDDSTEETTSSSDDDTASWLKSLDEPEETPVETGSAVPANETDESSNDLPSWLSGFDEEKTKAPADFGDLPAWMRDETGELVAEPTKIEPTRATDWTPADGEKPEAIDAPPPVAEPEPEPVKKKPAPQKKEAKPASEPYKEPVTRKATGVLEMPIDPVLGSARNELMRSNIPGALETYGKLIKKGRFLEEVIYDLRDALYRYPVEVSIWQSLGDAYMRANQLQDALDAYTKAEELLR
ncbi:MAG TPA: hypothetical protein DCX53_02980 [Anaerolineae bacterium]|nr:hypothetical protein [Anaerolineae bacterium]